MSTDNNTTAAVCEITTTLSDAPTHIFGKFRNTEILSSIHNAPRFGKSNDILSWIIGTEEEQNQYLKGLAASCLGIGLFCLVWAAFLIYAKRKGPERFGPFSGRRCDPQVNEEEQGTGEEEQKNGEETSHQEVVGEPEKESIDEDVGKSEENSNDNESIPQEQATATSAATIQAPEKGDETETDHDDAKLNSAAEPPTPSYLRQTQIMKYALIFSCFGIIISSCFLAFKGGDALVETVNQAKESLEYSLGLMNDGAEILDDIVVGLDRLQTDGLALLQSMNNMCPNVRERICTNLDDFTTCDGSGIFSNDSQVVETLVDYFNTNRTLLARMEQTQEGLNNIIAQTEAANDMASDFNWALYLSIFLVIPLCLICFWIMVVVFFTNPRNKLRRFFPTKYIVPAIGFFAFVSFIFATVFIISSMALADTCIDDPDARVLTIAEYYANSLHPVVYEFVLYYMTRCQVQPVQIVEEIDILVKGVNVTNLFSEELKTVLSNTCGGDGFSSLETVNMCVNGILCSIANLGVLLRKFFQCSTWYPLYQNIVQDTLCISATPAFAWIAATQFVVLILTMVILTCRVVLWDLKEVRGEVGGDNNKEQVVLDAEVLDIQDDTNAKSETAGVEKAAGDEQAKEDSNDLDIRRLDTDEA